jgi:hypothetical protein
MRGRDKNILLNSLRAFQEVFEVSGRGNQNLKN